MNMTNALEFDEPETKKRASPEMIQLAARIVTRDDVEIIFVAFFMAATALAASWATAAEGQLAIAFSRSIVIFMIIPTFIYGSRVMGRMINDGAQGWVMFSRTINLPRLNINGEEGNNKETAHQPLIGDSPQLIHETKWREALRRFLLAAKFRNSFSVHQLAHDEKDEHGNTIAHKMMSDPAVRVYQDILTNELHILAVRKGKYDYAPGWNYGRACAYLRHEPITVRKALPPEITF